MSDADGRFAKPRILHVLAGLDLGGIETWLMHVLRGSTGAGVAHEILLLKDHRGAYEDEVDRLGIPVHRLPLWGGKSAWPLRFRKFLKEQGPFDTVHAHCLPHFNTIALTAARLAGVRQRIAHNHSARTVGLDCSASLRAKTSLARWGMGAAATTRIGISEAAITEIAGAGWPEKDDCKLLLYGFDFSPYVDAGSAAFRLRERLGFDEDDTIIGIVGRLVEVKNHALLIDAFRLVVRADPSAHLVIVGEGPLESELKGQVEKAGLTNSVHFVGTTREIPAFMAMFDVMCLPSDSEGLGIVALEAQAGGTPVVVSENVPAEIAIVPGAVTVAPLAGGAEAWCQAILDAANAERSDPARWLASVEASAFGLQRCIAELESLYLSAQHDRSGMAAE